MILWVDWALLGASLAWCVSQGDGHLEAQPVLLTYMADSWAGCWLGPQLGLWNGMF